MSKVICEICGTAYPDTEKECPVCGFEKPETAEFAPDDIAAPAVEVSDYVRGGRFSKSNVSKKNNAAAASSGTTGKGKSAKKKSGSDIGLIIAIVLLLLSIACTSAYIYFTYFAYEKRPADDPLPAETTTEPTTEPTRQTLPTQDTTAPVDLSCTDLTLYEQSVLLNKAGSEWLLNVVPTPANTTDEITYSSADQNIATVSADGRIVAVADGETVITITCGSVSVECKVICQFPEATEPQETEPEKNEPEETAPEQTDPKETKPQGDFKFNTKYYQDDRWEVTMSVGDTWSAYAGDIDVEDIQWSVGNTSVATVKNGKVKAVGAGWTTLRAVYNGVEYKCIIYVQ